jgi:hypothetical protein
MNSTPDQFAALLKPHPPRCLAVIKRNDTTTE